MGSANGTGTWPGVAGLCTAGERAGAAGLHAGAALVGLSAALGGVMRLEEMQAEMKNLPGR
jgi:hypothetical protein